MRMTPQLPPWGKFPREATGVRVLPPVLAAAFASRSATDALSASARELVSGGPHAAAPGRDWFLRWSPPVRTHSRLLRVAGRRGAEALVTEAGAAIQVR